MKILRFTVSALFAWMLIRTTFANTVELRHPAAFATAREQRAPPTTDITVASRQR